MIVSMKHLDILCVAAEKDAALEALRALGAVHLDLAAAQGAAVQGAKEEIAAAVRTAFNGGTYLSADARQAYAA